METAVEQNIKDIVRNAKLLDSELNERLTSYIRSCLEQCYLQGKIDQIDIHINRSLNPTK